MSYPKTSAIPTLLRHGGDPLLEVENEWQSSTAPWKVAWKHKNYGFFFWCLVYSPFCLPLPYFLLLLLSVLLVFIVVIRLIRRRRA